MSGVLLLLLLGAAEQPDPGLAAYREGRYEEAAQILGAAMSEQPTYDGLLTLGLARGRLGRLQEARQAFDRAILLEPRRPEALVERGGAFFIEERYAEAIEDLERASELRDEPYTRDLLASSLHLAGRGDEALALWNAVGQPALDSVEVLGLKHTSDPVVRRELEFARGRMLDLDSLRAARLRLQELRIFDQLTLRPVAKGSGKADLEVAVAERHGLYSSLLEFGVGVAVDALVSSKTRLQYSNLGGQGINVGVQYRWDSNRPELAFSFDVPRPFGLPANLHALAYQGRQNYDLEGELERRSYGVELNLRRVLGARTVGQVGFRLRDRSYSRPFEGAPSGTIVGPELVLERRLLETYRQRLNARLSVFQSLDSSLRYTRGLLTLGYRGFLRKPDTAGIESGVVAAQLRLGYGTSGLPLDEMFVPGAGSTETDFPLRAHPDTDEGRLGRNPIGRSIGLANVEWRHRLFDSLFQLGVVVLYDGARIGEAALGPTTWLHDVGVGLRLSLQGGTIVRLDYGYGLADGKTALIAGVNHIF